MSATAHAAHAANSSYTPQAVKRIMLDLRNMEKSNLTKDGIYFYYNEDNLGIVKAMIIGPSETPYEHGFYFFSITLPYNYPFHPPSVQFETLASNVRFNPNLYTQGKVCLSLINTWDGPKWTACQSLSSILLSIQAMILVQDPLKNEPCYYHCRDRNILDPYNKVVTFENYRVAIKNMLQQTPAGFEVFLPDMKKYIVRNHTKIMKHLEHLKNTISASVVNLSYYCVQSNVNYETLYMEFQEIVGNLLVEMPEEIPQEAESEPVSQAVPEPVPEPEPIAIAQAVPEPEEIVAPVVAVPIGSKKYIKASMRLKLAELEQLCVDFGIVVKVHKKKEILEQINQYNDSL